MRRLLLILLRLVSIVGVAEVVRESRLPENQGIEARKRAVSAITADSVREDRSDWNKPRPERTPHPTYWPAVVGLGVMFFTWGIISNLLVLMLGVLVLLVGFTGWIGDLLSEG